MASIRDVALKAGVSPTTVSRTFRTPNLLTEETQHLVLQAAEQLGYSHRPAPVFTKRTRSAVAPRPVTKAIGFQFIADSPDVVLASNVFYAPMLAGAQAEANALGLHLLVHSTDTHTVAQELPRMVDERIIEGMLLVGTASRPILDRFANHVPKIILVDNWDETGAFESVISDGFGGGRAATQHLIELGHRRICFFTTRKNIPTFRDRMRGYWCALLEAGITPDLALVVEPEGRDEDWGPFGITDRLRALFEMPGNPVTAVLAANDDCAVLAQRVGRQVGLRLPEDLSIIGFDDVPLAAHADPPLTTVRVDKEAMGRLAVRILSARLTAEQEKGKLLPTPPVQQVLPVSIVHRDSCQRYSPHTTVAKTS